MKQSIIEFQIISIYLIVILSYIIKKNDRKIYHSHLSQNKKKTTPGLFFLPPQNLPSPHPKQQNFHHPNPNRNEPNRNEPNRNEPIQPIDFVKAVVLSQGTLGFTPAIVAFSNHSSAAVKPSNFDTFPNVVVVVFGRRNERLERLERTRNGWSWNRSVSEVSPTQQTDPWKKSNLATIFLVKVAEFHHFLWRKVYHLPKGTFTIF